MLKRIITAEQQIIKRNAEMIEKQKANVFNYSIDDFEIYDSQWKHKDWETWCKGAGRYDKTKELVERYIAECAKPYGQRNLDWLHLA